MNFKKFEIHLFNNNLNSFFYILIKEKETINIYSNTNLQEITYRSSDLNFQLVKVRRILALGEDHFYEIEKNDKKLGYFSPKDSIMLFPKKREQVKILENSILKNEFNEAMNIHLEDNSVIHEGKIVYSTFYSFFNDVVYEGLIYQNSLLGFFPPQELDHLYKYETEFSLKRRCQTFMDANLNKPFKEIQDMDKTFNSKYILTKERKIRFHLGGKDIWIDEDNVDISYAIEDHFPTTLQECLITSLFFTLDNKLNDYHKYYQQLLKKR